MDSKYTEIYGTWSVTTEDDVEGRSIRHLGVFTGYVDEIALHLADKCFYSLNFKKVESNMKYTPKKERVHVKFDIESETWKDINNNTGIFKLREVFKNRPVHISDSNYYASFVIESHNANEIKKQRALSKLNDDDKRILGLK